MRKNDNMLTAQHSTAQHSTAQHSRLATANFMEIEEMEDRILFCT